MSFRPTAEQQAIATAFRAGHPLVIEAAAGSGKTSTLRMLAEMLRSPYLYLAFNKAIQVEAANRFPNGKIACKTAHGLAWRPEYRERMRRHGRQMPGRVASILGIHRPALLRQDHHPLTPARLAALTLRMVAEFCKSADPDVSIKHTPIVPGLEDPASIHRLGTLLLPFAHKAWREIADPEGALQLDFAHFLKLYQLSQPVLPYDVIFYDEAQDANPVILDVIQRQTHARIIAVGDRAQGINRWNGAIDAMDRFKGQRFKLSKSFRFGPRIADEANKWLEQLAFSDLRVVGHTVDSDVRTLDVADMILCRSNSGTIAEIMDLRDRGVDRIGLAGKGTAKDIKNMAEAALTLKDGLGCDHPDLVAFTDWDELCDYVDDDDNGAGDLRRFVKLVNRYGPWALIFAVRDLVDVADAEVVVSTAHKAKGLEADRVRVSDDFPVPDLDENGVPIEPFDEEEGMLSYVTVTRARLHLDRGPLSYIDELNPVPTLI
jgi:hypothetical protein